MNIFTHEIAQYLEITLDYALQVQDFIDHYIGLDWSEATTSEIEICATLAELALKGAN